jgi:Fuc2NAc and GlcNAc transferase
MLLSTCALVLTAWLTGVTRRLALSHNMLDVPNERSSHTAATPRAGGIPLVLVSLSGWLVLTLMNVLRPGIFVALLGGGIAVAAVGFLDDRRSVSAGARLSVHVVAALWACAWIGELPALRFGDEIVRLGWAGNALAVVGVVWVLNLFNFMDGIDGIAASEAAFVACGGALLMHLAGTNTGISSAGLVFGAACVGFLFWNWPPAKIFMGDVGSGYVGYVLGVLALAAAHENSAVAWVWLALGGLFFVDATVTLVRRALQGERLQDAHRRHAYQWLARRWRSHRRVTLTVIALNVFWLLPCALIAALRPALAFRVLMVALAPLVVLVLVAGAGRRENIVS